MSAPAHDATVSGSGNGVNSWTLPGLSTAGTNRAVYLACHTSNSNSITPTSTNLTFVQIGTDMSLSGNGKMRVFRAFAASQLSSEVITLTTSGNPQSSAVATSISNPDTTGSSGSGATGATNTFTSGGSSAPTAAVTTTRADSLVISFICQTANQSVTAGTNQTINATSSNPGFSGSSSERQNSGTAVSGTSVTGNATLGGSVACGLITIEVKSPAVTTDTSKFMSFF